MPTADKLISAYVQLRDMKKEMQERHKKELLPINTKMQLVESGMLAMLNNAQAESMRSDSGTMYKIARTSVKIEDWETALNFVQTNDLWHMLEHRLAKASVVEYIEANQNTPPGVSIVKDTTVGVRRS